MKKSKMHAANNLIIILIISFNAFMQLLIVNGQENDTLTMYSNNETDMNISMDMDMDMNMDDIKMDDIKMDDMNIDMENSTIIEEETTTNNIIINNITNNLYWPPIYNDETIELEKILMENLDLGCTVTTNHTNGMISNNTTSIDYNEKSTINVRLSPPPVYFMISETENREKLNNPHPRKFVHLPTGKSVELNFECDDCPNDKIIYNGKMYDTTKFECKTLCIFTAIKSYKDTCRKGQMYKIGLKMKNKFYKLIESCHHLEMPTNITYDAQTLIWKLGKFSRTMQNEKMLCQPKCMPVCRELNSMEYNNLDLLENNENYAMEFMENLCNDNTSEKIYKNIENIICVDKTNDSGSILKLSNFGFLLVIVRIILEFGIM